MDQLIDPTLVAFVLSSPTRYDMLRATLEGARTVGELAELLGVHPSTASVHVARLLDAGLVTVTQRGTRRLVRARARVIQMILDE